MAKNKQQKKLKKAIKRALKRSIISTVAEKQTGTQTGTQTGWSTLSKAIGGLAKSKGESQRRKALVKSMDAAVAVGDMQSARAFSFELAREDIVRVRKEAFDSLARAGLSTQRRDPIAARSDQDQPREILQGSGRAVSNAQRPRSREVGNSQRATLRDAYSGDYEPERPDPDETMLASQRKIIDLETQLRKAISPSERERLGYQLTRAKLVDGHMRGEI